MRASAANSLRASRTSGIARAGRVRFQSTQSATSTNHIAVGMASGAGGALLLYLGWLYGTSSGKMSRTVSSSISEAQKRYNMAASTLQAKTPSTDDAIETLRSYAYSYVAFIPGGRGMVDTVFKDIDQVRESHGKEVDELVRDTYQDLSNVSKKGLSWESFHDAAEVLNEFSRKISKLAAGSVMDIMENHPQIKNRLGGPINQLKQMGDSYGPEAKKQYDQTVQQIQDLMQSGFSAETMRKAKNLVDEKTELLRNMGNQAWEKGYEQAKPMLEKNPQVKKLIEDNKDALMSGNAMELFQKAKDSLSSGNTSDIEKYVRETVDKSKNQASGMSLGSLGSMSMGGMSLGSLTQLNPDDFQQYAKMIPGGEDMLHKLTHFKNVAQNNREEGEKLLKETMEEIQKVISKQADKAKSLVEKNQK